MSNEDKIRISPKYIQEVMDLHLGLTEEQVRELFRFIAEKFIKEIEQGLEGNIDYPDAPFFEAVVGG